MTPRALLLLIVFIESFATIQVERGIYFFSSERLGFSEPMNLALALAFGLLYVGGALVSHRLSARFGEKRVALAAVGGQLLAHALLALAPVPWAVLVGNTLVGLFNGLKWPVLESYVAAGHTPTTAARAVGRFNLAWASAVPLSLLAAGPAIDYAPSALFVLAGSLNVLTLLLLLPLPARCTHLPDEHPERPRDAVLRLYRGLLASSRWMLLCSYSMAFIVAPLVPAVFASLGVDVEWATGLSGLLDVMRVLAFAVLGAWAGWHRRRSPIVAATLALPLGFALILFGASVPLVLLGEVLFGLSMGMIYYAALYYAMVVKNAAVEAGGAHEGLIGGGFALGPLLGLLAAALARPTGSIALGLLVAVGPLYVLTALAAVRAMGGGARGGAGMNADERG